MRKLIEKAKALFEMPSMISGSRDFGWPNESLNKERAQTAFSDPDKQMLYEDDDCELFQIGDASTGRIYLFNKRFETIDYYVQYETSHWKMTGQTITQIEVWRTVGIAYFKNITTHVFFKILLPRFGSIMSDEQQTEDGKRFWLRVMDEASHDGYHVAFIDFKGSKKEYYSSEIPITKWALQTGAWGVGDKFLERRFLIEIP